MARVNTNTNPKSINDEIIGKNTMKILMLICLFYIISHQKLTFSIGEFGNKASSSVFAYGFEDVDLGKTKKIKTKEVALASTEKVEIESKKVVLKKKIPNNLHNATFLLDKNSADKFDISPETVRFKNKLCSDYVKKYLPIAKVEQQKFGIPASITLAQGILESDAGVSNLSKSATNQFGIKCFSHHCKKGHCKNFTDDSHKDFFVVYQNVWQSFRAHSQFLAQNRYQKLFKLKKNDYKGWAKGLKSAGYATDKNYDQKLIKIIEALNLQQLD